MGDVIICSADDCDRPADARRADPALCKRCWVRWRKHGDPNVVLPKTGVRKHDPVCQYPECDRPHHAHGWCSMHAQRVQTHGDPDVVLPKLGRHRLDEPTYEGAHKRVLYDRGKASSYTCVDCGRPAREWSYDGGAVVELTRPVGVVGPRGGQSRVITPLKYSADPADYSPRCTRCHRYKDGSILALSEHRYIRPKPGA